jgi:peptidoglycan/LPS O-acetylase OafA/YrhL
MNSRTIAAVLVVIGGALLFVSLFVQWYDPGTSGWTAFEVLDLVLAFAAVAAFSAGVGALFGERWPEHARFVPVIGLVAFVIVLTQLIEPPPLVHDASRGAGGFLALVGSLILVGGGVLARRESVSDKRDSDDARRRTMQHRHEEGL